MTENSYWRVQYNPFDERYASSTFRSASFVESFARVNYLVDRGERLGLVTGRCGCGKSFLLRELKQSATRRDDCVVLLNVLGLNAREYLERLVLRLGGVLTDNSAPTTLWRAVFDQIQINMVQNVRTVFLVDHADDARPDLHAVVQRLMHWPSTDSQRPTIILAVRSGPWGEWAAPYLAHCPLRVELEPWTFDETSEFIRQSVAQAGRSDAIFTEDAVSAVHALSRGIPRRVLRLADWSFLAGAAEHLDIIDGDTVRSVHRELSPDITRDDVPSMAYAQSLPLG